MAARAPGASAASSGHDASQAFDLGPTRDRHHDPDRAGHPAGHVEHGLAGRGLEVGDRR